jgi:hypothetical protein
MFGVRQPTRGFLAFTPALVTVCLRADLPAGSCGEKRTAIGRHRACLGRFNHRAHQNTACDDHDGAGLVIAWDALHARGAGSRAPSSERPAALPQLLASKRARAPVIEEKRGGIASQKQAEDRRDRLS